MNFSITPEPPYYVVNITSTLLEDTTGYFEMEASMLEVAKEQAGLFGVEIARNADGFGIMSSYWKDAESMFAWRDHVRHLVAQYRAKEEWLDTLIVRVAVVERDYVISRH